MAINDRDHGSGSPVEDLKQSLTSLIAESQALRGDVQEAEAARRRATTISLAALAVLALFTGLLVVMVYQNNQLSQQINGLTMTMVDCTTPGGKCYGEGGKRTSGAISSVISAEIYVAQCARLFPGEGGEAYDRKLKACVQQRLAEDAAAHASPSPSPAPSPSPSGGRLP